MQRGTTKTNTNTKTKTKTRIKRERGEWHEKHLVASLWNGSGGGRRLQQTPAKPAKAARVVKAAKAAKSPVAVPST
jgi:hypothetical protein